MAFSEGEVCRICLSVNIRMFALKETGLQNLYKTLTNSFSIPKPHKVRGEIKFTPIYHIDIWPVECDIDNDCKDEIFCLDAVKVEEEIFEYENSKFEENENHETEPYIIPTNHFSKASESKIKSNSTDCNINDVRKENLDLESPTIKSKPKVKKDNQPINKKGKRPAKIMKKKILKQKSVNILTKKTSGASTKYNFECDGSSKKFSTKDILAKHISYSHNTQKNSVTTAVRTQVEQTPVPQLTETFNCDICEFKTSQKRCILAHLNAHVAEQVYCCNNCDYKCVRKDRLQTHMKIHTGEKHFWCHICKYQCIHKSSLQTHMRIHTGEKPFSCHICKYQCIQKSSLQTHMKIHTGEKPFSCHICKYQCIRKSNLQAHMKIHTGEKPFSCHICKYQCIHKSSLQTHMKIHTGEKPFSCHICKYQCTYKSSLLTHMKIHTGEKPFSCNICDYKCIRKCHLQRHMKTHT
ncbi:unnamed protein product [Parnassius mnemosyne]|uniref:C2H2-type domain-containing protein n=1 Tax=Parnassius mnemosyne TaxID=213953 RepID=A0AAV1LCH0_9NEOP